MRLNRTARLTTILTVVFGAGHSIAGALQSAEPVPNLPTIESTLTPGTASVLSVAAPAESRLRSILISLAGPGRIAPGATIDACIEPELPTGDPAPTLSKILHLGDPDVVWIVQQAAGKRMRIKVVPTILAEVKDSASRLRVTVRVADLGAVSGRSTRHEEDPVAIDRVALEAEPNDTPDSANPVFLGQTVYGLADDRLYLPFAGLGADPEQTPGVDWFTFTHDSDQPRLVFFSLDFVDRDVPPDVRIYQRKNGRLIEYTQGIDPQSLQRERPPRPAPTNSPRV